tara:strand:- start:725 stop:982 length:258 start_codon:yes stop_codon:yes gene_type:complete
MKLLPMLILKSVVVSVVLNLVLSLSLKQVATPDQVACPPNGSYKLNFFDKLMHMFVHHAQVPVASSLIVAVVVALSVLIASIIPL